MEVVPDYSSRSGLEWIRKWDREKVLGIHSSSLVSSGRKVILSLTPILSSFFQSTNLPERPKLFYTVITIRVFTLNKGVTHR